MTWDDYTENEQISILKSMFFVASSDNHISYTEEQFISMTALRMSSDFKTLINKAIEYPQSDMIYTLKEMDVEKKDTTAFLWLKLACKANGNFSGKYCINDLPESKDIIVQLADLCQINISDYLYKRVMIDEFYF